MKTKPQIFVSILFMLQLSACATFDNVTKLPVENLRVSGDYETADLYKGKVLALTVFSPDDYYVDYRHDDSGLIDYGRLFDKTIKEKRPAIDLLSMNEISNELPKEQLASLTSRLSSATVVTPADISTLTSLSGADYIMVAKIRGFSTDRELKIDTNNAFNSGWINYKSARSSFSIYDATNGKNIWFGSFDHTSDNSWGEPTWQYMMERMYEGFVLRLPKPAK